MPDFAATYQQHLPYVWRSLARLGVPATEREDLTHDVFVAALRAWAKFDATRPIEPWLFGITFRRVLDFKRKHQTRFEAASGLLDSVDPARGPHEDLERAQGLALAARALDRLELDRRAVFVMHEIDGHGVPEIAVALGLPLNTAYSRLRLARRDFNAAAESLVREKAEHHV